MSVAEDCSQAIVVVFTCRLCINARDMLHIFPIGLPDAQDFEPPFCTVPLHSGNRTTQDPANTSFDEWPAILLPQAALVPKLECPVDERWLVVVQIIDDEVLLTTRLGFSPRTCDAGIKLQDQASVVANGLASSIHSFADTKASAKRTRVGDPKE
jgi:hypothetical protein